MQDIYSKLDETSKYLKCESILIRLFILWAKFN